MGSSRNFGCGEQDERDREFDQIVGSSLLWNLSSPKLSVLHQRTPPCWS